MDLSTSYLGLNLPHPFLPGSSPLADRLDMVRRLEDAGAPMIVVRSLFEEQIVGERLWAYRAAGLPSRTHAEETRYFPLHVNFMYGPDEYLDHLRRVKQAVGVPVVGSLNGTTPGGWLKYAEQIEQAGADALELNVYDLATSVRHSSGMIEGQTADMVRKVKALLKIPVAVKLSPFYTALPAFVCNLQDAGAEGVILFNRFYQPDIDIEELEVAPSLHLSDSHELRLRLQWIAILYGKVQLDLALTGGVHTPQDAIKAIMCGAAAVQMTSALLLHGPEHLKVIRDGVEQWMDRHGYQSLTQMRGSMSLKNCSAPKAFERANYMQNLQAWDKWPQARDE